MLVFKLELSYLGPWTSSEYWFVSRRFMFSDWQMVVLKDLLSNIKIEANFVCSMEDLPP